MKMTVYQVQKGNRVPTKACYKEFYRLGAMTHTCNSNHQGTKVTRIMVQDQTRKKVNKCAQCGGTNV
jgi:hypothetical protein